MLDSEDLLNGLIRGAMSGRRKSWRRTHGAFRSSGLVNPQTLLAAAGVAWGLFETWQQDQARKTAAAGGPAADPPAATGGLAAPPPFPARPPRRPTTPACPRPCCSCFGS